MQNIFDESKRVPKNIQTDNGTEFYNKEFKTLMDKYNINHYSTYTHLKASIVERFNRTLKEKMWREFSMQGTYKWINILNKLIMEYNNTKHRTLKNTPNEMNEEALVRYVARSNWMQRRAS